MMQPMDIKSHSFGTGLFGYKKADVDQYVDTVYRAYDELFTENKSLKDERDRLNAAIEESRMKIYELEGKLNGADSSDNKAEEKKNDSSVETKSESASSFEDVNGGDSSGKIKMSSTEKKEDTSATSKFFENSNDDVIGDGDDVFVGEIEDNRKPNKVMIGDGEEEGSDDFEFL